MKRVILILFLGVFTLTVAKSQVLPMPPAGDIIIVSFGEGDKSGELYFDEDTQAFISGWISYPVPNGGGLYYMLPVNSVMGLLTGSPLEPEEPEDCEDCPLPPDPNYSHFDGMIYYGSGSEWGSMFLHSGNNGVLQSAI